MGYGPRNRKELDTTEHVHMRVRVRTHTKHTHTNSRKEMVLYLASVVIVTMANSGQCWS